LTRSITSEAQGSASFPKFNSPVCCHMSEKITSTSRLPDPAFSKIWPATSSAPNKSVAGNDGLRSRLRFLHAASRRCLAEVSFSPKYPGSEATDAESKK